MAFMKVKQALIPHFSKLQRQSAALHAEIIRKLLAGEWNVEFIATPTLRLGGKIGHQLCPRCALAHVGELFVELQVLLRQLTQQMSRLSQWPVQIKLVPVNAPYFDGARLLIAADCTAYAYAAFHERFIKGHITLVGCPKLDSVDYSEKLTEIIRENDIKSVTVVRMEVPCCGGLELAAKKALQQSGKFIPWQVVTVTVDGRLVEE